MTALYHDGLQAAYAQLTKLSDEKVDALARRVVNKMERIYDEPTIVAMTAEFQQRIKRFLGGPTANSRRTKWSITLLKGFFALGAMLLVGLYPMPAQKKPPAPSKKEAEAMLERAAEATNLRSSDSPPFHLRAKAKSYGLKGEAIKSIYDLWWSSPGQWREEINWVGRATVSVADGGRLWIIGEDTNRFDTYRLSSLLDFWSQLKVPAGEHIRRVQNKQVDGIYATCMEVTLVPPGFSSQVVIANPGSWPWEGRAICLDNVANLPLRVETGSTRRLSFDGYAALSTKHFPHVLLQIENGKRVIEAEVESLETLDPALSTTFARPAGAVSRPWCPNTIPPKPLQLAGSRALSFPGGGWSVQMPPEVPRPGLVVFHVDDKGHVLDVNAFNAGGQVLVKDSDMRALLKSVFQPASCQGKPIEADFLMHLQ